MNLSDILLFIVAFSACVAIASIVVFLAAGTGSPRPAQPPGTDFYSSPVAENPDGFTAPKLTDITPYTQPHDVAGTVDPRR